MTRRFVTACFVILLMLCISSANSCKCKCKSKCKKDTPLKFIFQIVSHFKEVQSCDRIFISNRVVSENGVSMISYSAEFSENESALDVCSCKYRYLSQRDWLDGATQSCCVRKNIVTMTLECEPDPTINQKTDDSPTEDPLEQLKSIFDQFRYAVLEKHQCRPSTRRDKSVEIHFEIQCDLRPDSPNKDEICEGIKRYLNQDNWLVDGKVLDMEISGKRNE